MLSLYIHIPFCRRKCAYCAFHSADGNEEQKEQYLNALLKAIPPCWVKRGWRK